MKHFDDQRDAERETNESEKRDILEIIDKIDPRLACLAWHNFLRQISNINNGTVADEESSAKRYFAIHRAFFSLSKELREDLKIKSVNPSVEHNLLYPTGEKGMEEKIRLSVEELKKYVNGDFPELRDSHLAQYLNFNYKKEEDI